MYTVLPSGASEEVMGFYFIRQNIRYKPRTFHTSKQKMV